MAALTRGGGAALARVAAVCAFVAGCGGDDPTTSTRAGGAGRGSSCSAAEPCLPWLLCVDGTCRSRPWPPGPADPSPRDGRAPRLRDATTAETPELGGRDAARDADLGLADAPERDAPTGDGGPGVDPDAGAELAEVAGDGGGGGTDGAVDGLSDAIESPDASGADVADATGAELADALPDAPGEGEVDDAPAGTFPDTVGEYVEVADAAPASESLLLVRVDEADEGLGSTVLVLGSGEAWVNELDIPVGGELTGIQIRMANVSGVDSCGLFRVAVWLPEGTTGEFGETPDWQTSEQIELTSTTGPENVIFDGHVPVPPGPVRVGLLLDGPCEGATGPPGLLTASSGETSGSLLWVSGSAGVPWVSADQVGMEGRWALRALVEVPSP